MASPAGRMVPTHHHLTRSSASDSTLRKRLSEPSKAKQSQQAKLWVSTSVQHIIASSLSACAFLQFPACYCYSWLPFSYTMSLSVLASLLSTIVFWPLSQLHPLHTCTPPSLCCEFPASSCYATSPVPFVPHFVVHPWVWCAWYELVLTQCWVLPFTAGGREGLETECSHRMWVMANGLSCT